jgi:uncharacterized membrane protein
MSKADSVSEPALERKGTRFQANAARFLLLGIILVVPGIVMIILGSGWVFALGLALLALGLVPGAVAIALLLAGVVARWTARERPFA